MGNELSNYEQLMQVSEGDIKIIRAVEDCQLGIDEIIYFVSESYPLLPRMTKNKPFSQIISSIMPRIASKYRRDINGYRNKLERFLNIISTELPMECYPGYRVSKLQDWIKANAKENHTTT